MRSDPNLVDFFYISTANIRIIESKCRNMIRVIFKYRRKAKAALLAA